MLISELLNSKVEHAHEPINKRNAFITRATIGEREIEFEAKLLSDNVFSEDNCWTVDFSEIKNLNRTAMPTGSGKEYEVFAFVVDSFHKFMEAKKPNIVTFSASHDGKNQTRNSRAELYKRLLKKAKVTGYSIEEDGDDDGDNEFVEFRLIKKHTG